MARISIENMKFFAHHGCFKEEAMTGTHFVVTLSFDTDTSDAQKSDKLEDTADYQAIYHLVKDEMKKRSNLLEHVGQRILKALADQYPETRNAEVKISKMNPPLGGGVVGNVSVTLTSEDVRE